MKQGFAVTACAAMLALGAAAGRSQARADARPDTAAAAKGKIIYQRYCGSCHRAEARGDGALAPDLQVVPTDLTRLAVA